MKLLLDENLSRRLVPFLQQDYPGSTQVALIGLERADDKDIWEFAKTNGFVIVTRDADFEDMSIVKGRPPQVIWLKTSNQAPGTTAWMQEVGQRREQLPRMPKCGERRDAQEPPKGVSSNMPYFKKIRPA